MLPNDLQYSKEHTWFKNEANKITVGITPYAEEALGEVIFVELPEVGKRISSEDVLAVLESVKAVAEIYAPCDGKVVAVNETLIETPELINQDPFGDGWLLAFDVEEFTGELLSVAEYEAWLNEL